VFVAENGGGYRGTAQIAWGWFLIIFSDPERRTSPPEIRAAVRWAHLAQCGHFMMGSVRVGTARVVLSGTYGSDGLPTDCPTVELWERLYKVPPFLQRVFWAGGGHNSAGSEGPALHQWASEHLNELRASGTKDAARTLDRYRHTVHRTHRRRSD
jgi:hypothetical protein